MTSWPRRATTGLLLAALTVAPAHSDSPAVRVVRYSADDTLTVRLTNVPVSEVLDEIGHQAGAEIHGQADGTREISADFEAVPLPEALHRLLGNQNFALVYGDKGNLKAVRLLGEAQVSSAASAPTRATTPTTSPPSPEDTISAFLARRIPLPAGSRLPQVFSAPTAPARQVLDVGLRSEEAAVRADTVRALLQAIEADPKVRMAVAQAVGELDDGSLAVLLRGAAGEHAEEVATLVANQTKIAVFRAKATGIMGMINNIPE